MIHYIIKWPNKSYSIAAANNKEELYDMADTAGDPHCALYAKLPDEPFFVDQYFRPEEEDFDSAWQTIDRHHYEDGCDGPIWLKFEDPELWVPYMEQADNYETH